jgi:hypothetical protein
MVDEGAVLDSFPDDPIPLSALNDLEDHDTIVTAIPVMSEAHGSQELANRVVIQTDAAAIVAVYDDTWTVDHRVDGTDRDNDEVFEEAMVAAQGESSLVDAPDKT